jgi:hypothetical protein
LAAKPSGQLSPQTLDAAERKDDMSEAESIDSDLELTGPAQCGYDIGMFDMTRTTKLHAGLVSEQIPHCLERHWHTSAWIRPE